MTVILSKGVPAMHFNEIGASCNAFCITNYGVGQFLLKFSVYIKCLGEGQNALYSYLFAIVFRIARIKAA